MVPCKHLIENNYFTRFGEIQRSYAPAVKLGAFTTGIGVEEGNAVGITVRHNLVHNAPHAAFIYGGNNNIMEYNEVFDIAQVTGDVGAFIAVGIGPHEVMFYATTLFIIHHERMPYMQTMDMPEIQFITMWSTKLFLALSLEEDIVIIFTIIYTLIAVQQA